MKPINKEHYRRITVIDIETLGKATNAKIATIGAVVRHALSSEILGEFYVRCDLVQPRRTFNIEMLDWWLEEGQKNPLAHDEVFGNVDRIPLDEALSLLSQFIEAHHQDGVRPQVMGNGSEFDNVILADAFEQFSIEMPWDYGANQSLRTVVLMGRALLGIDPKYSLPFTGIQHHALDDAKHESEYLSFIFRAFDHLLISHNALVKELSHSTDRLSAIWSNTGSMGAKAQLDENLQALSTIPEFLIEQGEFDGLNHINNKTKAQD